MTQERPPLGGRYALQRPLQSSAERFFAINASTGKRVVVSLVDAARKGVLQPAQGIKHRHLAAVIDVLNVQASELPEGTRLAPGTVAFVAEHVPGRSLRGLLEAGRVQPVRAVAWTVRLGEALQALHAAGAVHGALSPRSIIAEPPSRAMAPVLSQLVAPAVGAFCPPERLKGAATAPSDDVWALYATLFTALTGAPPFSANTREGLIKAVLSKPKPISAVGLDEPVLQEILARGLVPDRSARNSELGELLEALDAWERDPSKPLSRRQNVPRPGLRGLGDIVGGALGPTREDDLVIDDATLPDDQGTDIPEPSPQAAVVPFGGRGERSSSSGMVQAAPAIDEAPPAAARSSSSSLPISPPPMVPVQASPAPVIREAAQFTPAPTTKKRVSINPFERKRTLWPWLVTAALAGGAGVYLAVAPGPEPVVKLPPPPVLPPPKPKSKPALAKRSPAVQRDSCVAAHFPAESLPPSASFEFVCTGENFLDVTRRLHDLVIPKPVSDAGLDASTATDAGMPGLVLRGGAGKPAELAGLGLDWYELPATAIIRRTCCPGSTAVILPETSGWCEQLQSVVRRMADDSQRSVDLAPGARAFDKAVTCLFANRIAHPFSYKTLPTPASRHAFQQFLSRAAIIGTQN
jgi:serine/threonine protein kinase